MSKKPQCPVCNGGNITVATESRSKKVAGVKLSYPAEYSRCEQCGEEFYSRVQARAASKTSAQVVAAYKGRLGPAEIGAIRKKYRVTQGQIERILRIGKKTWLRWEAGLVAPNAATDQLLRQVKDSPDLFRTLAEAAGVVLEQETPVWASLVSKPDLAGVSITGSSGGVAYAGSAVYGTLCGAAIPYGGAAAIPGKVGWVSEAAQMSYGGLRASEDRSRSASPQHF